MAEEKSPFVPGARVAVDMNRYGGERRYRESFVDKVYKNGNFTLRNGGTQQWRPSFTGTSARETGSGWSRLSLRLWTPEFDAEISQNIERTKRQDRWRNLVERIRGIRDNHVTDALCDAIEAALPKPEAKP